MAIDSDLGIGRNMDAYYKNLIRSKYILPVMVYSRLNSFNSAPIWIQNKFLFDMPCITHHLEHCSSAYCSLSPDQHITHAQWQQRFLRNIYFLKNMYEDRCMWVLDMPMPILERAMRTNIVQVFHSELFEIGPAPYFNKDNIHLFKSYGRIFVPGRLLSDEIFRRTKLKRNDARVRMTGRVLNDTLYSGEIRRATVLKKYRLDPRKKTILYAPSWESQKIWPVGTRRSDIQQLKRFCDFIKDHDLNLIIRPHPICIHQYGIKPIILRVINKYKNIFFDDSTISSLYGPNNSLIASDILVTDLSTISADFMSLKRPAIFFYPDNSKGLWGDFFPSFEDVSRISYTVKGFDELYKNIEKLLYTRESQEIRNKREKLISYIFDTTDGTAGKLYYTEMEEFSLEIIRYHKTITSKLFRAIQNPFETNHVYSHPVDFIATIENESIQEDQS